MLFNTPVTGLPSVKRFTLSTIRFIQHEVHVLIISGSYFNWSFVYREYNSSDQYRYYFYLTNLVRYYINRHVIKFAQFYFKIQIRHLIEFDFCFKNFRNHHVCSICNLYLWGFCFCIVFEFQSFATVWFILLNCAPVSIKESTDCLLITPDKIIWFVRFKFLANQIVIIVSFLVLPLYNALLIRVIGCLVQPTPFVSFLFEFRESFFVCGSEIWKHFRSSIIFAT